MAHIRKTVVIPLLISVCLFGLLTSTLAACQPVTAADDSLPRLQALITDPRHWGYPDEILVHPNGLAYVAADTGEMLVLDGPETVAVVSRPGSDQQPDFTIGALAASPLSGAVYWTEWDGIVHVISGTEVIASIPDVGHTPQDITAHPETGLVYVASAHQREWPENQRLPSHVTVISGTEIITDLVAGYIPTHLEYNPVDGRIYVGQFTGSPYENQEPIGMLGIIDGLEVVTNTFLGDDIWFGSVRDIVVNPNDGSMYLGWHTQLAFWNRQSDLVIVPSGFGDDDMEIDPHTNLLYMSHDGVKNGVMVISGTEVITDISIPGSPKPVAIDETHGYVYVGGYYSGDLTVIRGTEVITTISTGLWGAWDIAVDEERGYIYMTLADSHAVAVFSFEEPETSPWFNFFPLIKHAGKEID
ncbi:MAG: hypothetical protein KDD92_16095 [Caldilineaceae bacterium]|nr:hypothetical protein [Caldilineaceae bacterium]